MIKHPSCFSSRRHWAFALTLAAASAAAVAQTSPPAAAMPGQPKTSVVSTPEVRQQNGISYVTGGIGDAGQAKVKALGKDMNLQLAFALAQGGNYVGDVAVSIADKGGKQVFDLKSSDPLLFVQLPPGSYKVTAKAKDKSVERSVNVPATGQHVEALTW